MKIAVIEDNDGDFALYTLSFLKGLDYSRFERIEDFIKTEDVFNTVILDLNLPDGFGLDLVKRVRGVFPGKIVVITGSGGSFLTGSIYKNIIDAGASEVFSKAELSDEHYISLVKEAIHEA